MKSVYKNKIGKFSRFAREVFRIQSDDIDDLKLAEESLEEFKNFLLKIKMPLGLRDFNIPDCGLKEIAKRCISEGPIGASGEFAFKDILSILKLAY